MCGGRTYGKIRKCIENGFAVNVENDVLALEFIAPAEDGVDDGEHFLDLDMFVAVPTGTSGREPMRAKVTAKSFASAGIGVDVEGRARWREEANTIPLESETEPPFNVFAGGFGNTAAGK
jgi:hypothetical protein